MSLVQPDYEQGSKKQVAEIKFLIHDLRVETFVNSIIHFHVTLNTDLEIYGIEQALAFHSDDLAELRKTAAEMRKALRAYANAVKNYSPDKTIIATGRRYLETIHVICDLVLNPLWGRFDRVISFLPDDSRSVRARNHYRNNLRWICGVYYRIEYFQQELDGEHTEEEFDLGDDVIHYTNNVIRGYIVEKGRSRVEIQLEKSGPAVVVGSRQRLRRTYFNLIMNAVDALQDKPVGMIAVSVVPKDGRVSLSVEDNGSGMYAQKVQNLLRDRESLDGELHSLGFVFVRQTVKSWGGELEIESEIGKGTKITINLPYFPDRKSPPQKRSRCQQYGVMRFEDPPADGGHTVVVVEEATEPAAKQVASPDAPAPARPAAEPASIRAPGTGRPSLSRDAVDADGDWDRRDKERNGGRIIVDDYKRSESDYPGCLFFIGVNYDLTIDMLQHQPYDRFYDMGHEDLNPMVFDSAIRGRLEENEEKQPELILKEPHSSSAYFRLKEIHDELSSERYLRMVRDEYVLIARKLIATGMPPDMTTHITGAAKYFPGFEETMGPEPHPLQTLAEQKLSTE